MEKIKMKNGSFLNTLSLLFGLCMMAQSSWGQTIAGTSGTFCDSCTPTGWNSIAGTPDIVDQDRRSQSAFGTNYWTNRPLPAAPNGDLTFIYIASNVEGVGTIIGGLTTGNSYTFEFNYLIPSGQDLYDAGGSLTGSFPTTTTGDIQVTIVGAGTQTITQNTTFDVWHSAQVTFTATGATQNIEIRNDPSNFSDYTLINVDPATAFGASSCTGSQNETAGFTFPARNCVAGGMFVMPMTKSWNAAYDTRPAVGGNPEFETQWGGNLEGITGADAKCQLYAESWGLPGEYEALLADPSLTGANDRLTKHWEDILYDPSTGQPLSNNGMNMTSDGDELKIKDIFSGYCGRTNIDGSGIDYEDLLLMPDGTNIMGANPSSGSPELVHGYLIHNTPIGNIPAPDFTKTCNNWTSTSLSATAWSASYLGTDPDFQVGGHFCSSDGNGTGQDNAALTCALGGDHAIYCVLKN